MGRRLWKGAKTSQILWALLGEDREMAWAYIHEWRYQAHKIVRQAFKDFLELESTVYGRNSAQVPPPEASINHEMADVPEDNYEGSEFTDPLPWGPATPSKWYTDYVSSVQQQTNDEETIEEVRSRTGSKRKSTDIGDADRWERGSSRGGKRIGR